MRKILFTLAKSPVGELIIGLAFGKLSSLLPVKKVFETDKVIAFEHPKPYWKHHILIVPKRSIKNLAIASQEDFEYINECLFVAQKVVLMKGWDDSNYTIVTNGGSRQEVAQLHFHLGSGSTLE
jgi:histidine triad (HIT) family protein